MSVTTTRTVNAGSFGSTSPGPFAGAVGSGVEPPVTGWGGLPHEELVVRASSALRTAVRSIVPSVPVSAFAPAPCATVLKSDSHGSMPGAHWSRQS